MTNFKLNKLNTDVESEFKSSHMFGCPDTLIKWNDNCEFFNDEVFLCQINLNDVKEELLPNDGILYFFLQTKSRPYRPIVRFTSDIDNLERIDFNNEITDELDEEYEITKDNGNDIVLLPNIKDSMLKSNEVILLKVKQVFLNKKIFNLINEDLYFIIKKEDLLKKDFSNIRLNLDFDN